MSCDITPHAVQFRLESHDTYYVFVKERRKNRRPSRRQLPSIKALSYPVKKFFSLFSPLLAFLFRVRRRGLRLFRYRQPRILLKNPPVKPRRQIYAKIMAPSGDFLQARIQLNDNMIPGQARLVDRLRFSAISFSYHSPGRFPPLNCSITPFGPAIPLVIDQRSSLFS